VGEKDRPWTVAIVCGASGVGKSSIARPLSVRHGVPLGDIDDIVTALKAITGPRDQPLLHYWDSHPAARSWSPEQMADLHLSVSDVLSPGFRAVIEDHLEFDAPVVLDGDYLVPELAAEFGDAVRAVVLDEPDTDRIAANLAVREPGQDHGFRAKVSATIGKRLATRARAVGTPVVQPWPWTDGLARVTAALSR
jgi:2-phosphoglycerate kinase